MPYRGPGDQALPANVKALHPPGRAAWVKAYNAAFAACSGEDCEATATATANAGIKASHKMAEPAAEAVHQDGPIAVGPKPTRAFLKRLYSMLRERKGQMTELSDADFQTMVKSARGHAGGTATAANRAALKGSEDDGETDEDEHEVPFVGAMIGLFLPGEAAAALAVAGGEAAADLHITLAFLGEKDELTEQQIARLMVVAEDCARQYSPLQTTLSGLARFFAGEPDDQDAAVLLVDGKQLRPIREQIICRLGLDVKVGTDFDYTPHITLAYIDKGAPLPELPVTLPPVLRLDTLTLALGEERLTYPLTASNGMNPVMYSETGQGVRWFLEQAFSAAEPPQVIQYYPAPGTWKHAKYGTVRVTEAGNAEMVQNFKDRVYGQDLPIDAEHQTKLSGAFGHVQDMWLNADKSVAARMAWNSRGERALAEDAFRYFSPEVFPEWPDPLTRKTFRNVAIGGAITTRPYFKESSLAPLVKLAASETVFSSEASEDGGYAIFNPIPKEEPMTTPNVTPEAQAMTEAQARTFTEMAAEIERLKGAEATAKTFAEETARQYAEATGRIAKMELSARTQRFTDEVLGKSEQSGTRWYGEVGPHVEHMEALALQFGEDSPLLTHYISLNRAHAAQLKTSNLFAERGQTGTGGAGGSAEERLDRMTKAYALEHKAEYANALRAVAMAEPQLYSEYLAELRNRPA